MPIQPVTVGKRIRDLRRRAALTQAALGARCEPPIRPEHIAHYECGLQAIGLNVLARIADALDVSLDELVPRRRRKAA